MSKGRIVHFEIQAEDMDRATEFYTKTFEWEVKEWKAPEGVYSGDEMQYRLVMTGERGTPGIDGGIVKRRGDAPTQGAAVNAYTCTIDVKDLDEMLGAVKENGGMVVVEKMEIKTVGWLAYCLDTEGNIFGMMQADPDAQMAG